MDKPTVIRILVAEKQQISRSGLHSLLSLQPDFDVIAVASTETQAIKLVCDLQPDVLVLDEALSAVLSQTSKNGNRKDRAGAPASVVLGSLSEKINLSGMFRAGARGVVLRDLTGELLIQSIRSVAKGRYWAVEKEADDLATAIRALGKHVGVSVPAYGLSPREMDVIRAIVVGKSNHEIAAKLGISEATVKHHLTNIFDKVGASTRLELALFSMHHGLVRREQNRK
jgi:two-component system, NarL family, nitrate/nitrite response regulator NarL